MAQDAITEVDSPGQICWRAIGVVGESGEEASDASDCDADGERDGVEVPGGGAESDVAFDEFDGEQTSDESADDGFASDEKGRVVQVLQRELRVFEPVKEFGAEGRAGYRGGDRGPAEGSGDGISEAAAEGEVDAEADDVRERFEEKMRVNGVGAEMEVDGEGCGIGGDGDGKLYAGGSEFLLARYACGSE